MALPMNDAHCFYTNFDGLALPFREGIQPQTSMPLNAMTAAKQRK